MKARPNPPGLAVKARKALARQGHRRGSGGPGEGEGRQGRRDDDLAGKRGRREGTQCTPWSAGRTGPPEKGMKEEEGGGPGAAPYSSRPRVPGRGGRRTRPIPGSGRAGGVGALTKAPRGDRTEGLGGEARDWGGGSSLPPEPQTPDAVVAGSSGERTGAPEGGRHEGEVRPGGIGPDSLPLPAARHLPVPRISYR